MIHPSSLDQTRSDVGGLVDPLGVDAIGEGGSQRGIKRALLVPRHDKLLQLSVGGPRDLSPSRYSQRALYVHLEEFMFIIVIGPASQPRDVRVTPLAIL